MQTSDITHYEMQIDNLAERVEELEREVAALREALINLRPLIESRAELEVPTAPDKNPTGWRAWVKWFDDRALKGSP